MNQIEIHDEPIRTISGSNDRGNYSFRVQNVYLRNPESIYPQQFEHTLYDDAQPLPVGTHYLADTSVYVNKKGKLAISIKLSPAKVTTAKVA